MFIGQWRRELGVRLSLLFSAPTTRGDNLVLKIGDEAIDAIKEEWKVLWLSRIDDKVRAEGIANQFFPLLSVDRGTVIAATRDYKPLDLREILRSNKVQNVERVLGPHPSLGGWTKFAKTILNRQTRARKWAEIEPHRNCCKNLQPKKGGRGWLHSY